MAASYFQKSDALRRRGDAPGYRVGWRLRSGFGKGHLDGEMTYAEANSKAQELQAQDKDKIYFPELILFRQDA